jgi:hypothetical protein
LPGHELQSLPVGPPWPWYSSALNWYTVTGVPAVHSSWSGPLRTSTHGRYSVTSCPGGAVFVWCVPDGPVTVTSAAFVPAFATTTA